LTRYFCTIWIAAAFTFSSPAPALAYSDAELIDGFNKTVFKSEIGSPTFGGSYLRKFQKPVRVFVERGGNPTQQQKIRDFIKRLPGLISGLEITIVAQRKGANFIVHPVKRSEYVKVARERVFRSKRATIAGRCMVRSVFSRAGISKSDAIIVTDEGSDLFDRCMTEEILQGLGPLNDDRSLRHSMFNDTSKFTSFRRFDRLLLNILYDPTLRSGFSQKRAQRLLPSITRRVQKRITGR